MRRHPEAISVPHEICRDSNLIPIFSSLRFYLSYLPAKPFRESVERLQSFPTCSAEGAWGRKIRKNNHVILQERCQAFSLAFSNFVTARLNPNSLNRRQTVSRSGWPRSMNTREYFRLAIISAHKPESDVRPARWRRESLSTKEHYLLKPELSSGYDKNLDETARQQLPRQGR